MADQPAKKKRQIKNPETFRERAQRATADSGKPSTASRLKQTGGQLSKPAGPIKRGISWLFNETPLRFLIPKYFRQSWQELKLVTWPNWTEGRRLTFAVLIFAVVFGLAIAGVDWVLDKVFQQLLLK